MKYYIYVCVLFILGSCSSEKRIARHCKKCIQKDSVTEKIVIKYKDTTLFISEKGEVIVLPNPCQELCGPLGNIKKYSQFSGRNGIVGHITTENNNLVLTCKADSLEVVICNLEEKLIERSKTITLEPEIVYRDTKWQGFTHIWFIITSIILVFFSLYKWYRFSIPKIK